MKVKNETQKRKFELDEEDLIGEKNNNKSLRLHPSDENDSRTSETSIEAEDENSNQIHAQMNKQQPQFLEENHNDKNSDDYDIECRSENEDEEITTRLYSSSETENVHYPPLVRYLLNNMDNLTPELKSAIQEDARHLGFWAFLDKYTPIPFKVLLSIFDVELPDDIEIPADEALPILRFAMNKKIGKRQKRDDINTIEQVVELLRKSKNIMVLTGAGVSVSCGIPDFRSKNGIYSRLSEFNLEDPQQMFDLDYFKFMPSTFYSFAHEIYPSNFKPSPSHKFIKLLQDKGKLLRNYTQNIDTIENIAGITKLVQCHGSFASASCIQCKSKVNVKDIEKHIFEKSVPICTKCPEDVDGIIKPDITFFGEKLPDQFDECFKEDKENVDLLIVMGSSLKVSPVADVKDKIPHHVPQILINLESLPHMAGFDVHLLGKCDVIVQELCRKLNWELDTCDSSETHVITEPLIDKSESDQKQQHIDVYQHVPPNIYLFEGAKIYEESSDSEGSSSDEDQSSAGEEDDNMEKCYHEGTDDDIGLESLYN